MQGPMRRLLPITLLAFALLGSAASAAPVKLGAGELSWNQVNVYTTPCSSSGKCTFMGFTADPRDPNVGAANGSVFADAPALGPIVDTTTPQGTSATHTFPLTVTGSSYDPVTDQGAIEFAGTLHFKSNSAVFGAQNFDITVTDPRVDITGTTGKLFATGRRSNGTTYDRSTPLFTLSGITETTIGGTVRLGNLIPAVATTGVFGSASQYPVGAGPNRDPNIFGGFAIELREPAPKVTVTPVADIPSSGGTLTVSGTGASRSTVGLYIFLAAASSANTDTNAVASPPAFSRVEQDQIAADGSFSTTLRASSPFTRLDMSQTDCNLVPCVVRTVAAQFADDRSQDTNTPVTFRKVYDIPTATYTVPTVTPTPTPSTSKKPKLTKLALTRTRVRFTLSKRAKVTGTVKRLGKGRKVTRKVSKTFKKGRRSVKIKRLPAGRYKVSLKPKGGARKTKTIRIKRGK